jgi:hypothetical protein
MIAPCFCHLQLQLVGELANILDSGAKRLKFSLIKKFG